MPRLTRWMIKASLLYFLAALITGLVVAGIRPLGLPSGLSSLGPIYVHLFMVGWVSQLIFGVVYWMFPKWSIERPRRSPALGWAVFLLLNLGLLIRAIAEPLAVVRSEPGWGWWLVASAAMQWAAGMAFVVNTWGRVRAR
jgi:hypothetical protein